MWSRVLDRREQPEVEPRCRQSVPSSPWRSADLFTGGVRLHEAGKESPESSQSDNHQSSRRRRLWGVAAGTGTGTSLWPVAERRRNPVCSGPACWRKHALQGLSAGESLLRGRRELKGTGDHPLQEPGEPGPEQPFLLDGPSFTLC